MLLNGIFTESNLAMKIQSFALLVCYRVSGFFLTAPCASSLRPEKSPILLPVNARSHASVWSTGRSLNYAEQ